MISSTELFADLLKRKCGEPPAEVHGYLPWKNETLVFFLGLQVSKTDIEKRGDVPLDGFDGNAFILFPDNIFEDFFGHFQSDFGIRQR